MLLALMLPTRQQYHTTTIDLNMQASTFDLLPTNLLGRSVGSQ